LLRYYRAALLPLKMSSSSMVLETERLILRRLSTDDAAFVLELLNEPSFVRYIGDRGVRNLEDAAQYILNRLVSSYERNGFGLYLVELRESRIPIGICGLVKRDTLPDPDIGFAFLPVYWSRGYAAESAAAMMNYAKEELGLNRILAITSPDNEASAKLLSKIGLRFERLIKLSEDVEEVKLFTSERKVEGQADERTSHSV
jgi:RimJ/RimL family protein N-acetyltransferase